MVIPWYQNSMRRLRLTGPSVCWSLGTWISYLNNKADNLMSWYISLPPIVVQNHTHFSFCLYQCSRIAKCIRAERFIKCVWMNSCLGFWLFGFGLVIVFTHILTPPTNTPPPPLARLPPQGCWDAIHPISLSRGIIEGEVEISFPQPVASRRATVSRRVSTGYLVL